MARTPAFAEVLGEQRYLVLITRIAPRYHDANLLLREAWTLSLGQVQKDSVSNIIFSNSVINSDAVFRHTSISFGDNNSHEDNLRITANF